MANLTLKIELTEHELKALSWLADRYDYATAVYDNLKPDNDSSKVTGGKFTIQSYDLMGQLHEGLYHCMGGSLLVKIQGLYNQVYGASWSNHTDYDVDPIEKTITIEVDGVKYTGGDHICGARYEQLIYVGDGIFYLMQFNNSLYMTLHVFEIGHNGIEELPGVFLESGKCDEYDTIYDMSAMEAIIALEQYMP